MGERRDDRLLVVAIGGEVPRDPRGVVEPAERLRAFGRWLHPVVDLVAARFRLVLTHGMGAGLAHPPRRARVAEADSLSIRSLDLSGAEAQGVFGYTIQQLLANLCRTRGLAVPVVTLVTQVVVDPCDPAFTHPATPIGPFYPEAKAKRLARREGWTLLKQGRRGFRRVVASPRPRCVLELEAMHRLSEGGAVVIAGGNGGIAVVATPDGYRGVDALVERDLTTEIIATELGAARLLMLTAVERVAVNFGTPQQVEIERLTLTEARTLLAAGEFPPHSMGPKVEAGVRFVEAGGDEAIITSPECVRAALDGEAGTHIVP